MPFFSSDLFCYQISTKLTLWLNVFSPPCIVHPLLQYTSRNFQKYRTRKSSRHSFLNKQILIRYYKIFLRFCIYLLRILMFNRLDICNSKCHFNKYGFKYHKYIINKYIYTMCLWCFEICQPKPDFKIYFIMYSFIRGQHTNPETTLVINFCVFSFFRGLVNLQLFYGM